MKYDLDRSLCEVDRRKSRRLHRRARDKTLFAGVLTALLACLTALAFAAVAPLDADRLSASPYGAFLLDGGGGGYVLVGVLAFAFGAAFTLLCIRLSRLKKASKEADISAEASKEQKTED